MYSTVRRARSDAPYHQKFSSMEQPARGRVAAPLELSYRADRLFLTQFPRSRRSIIMKNRKTDICFLLVAVVITFCIHSLNAASIPKLYNTGVDDNGALL